MTLFAYFAALVCAVREFTVGNTDAGWELCFVSLCLALGWAWRLAGDPGRLP